MYFFFGVILVWCSSVNCSRTSMSFIGLRVLPNVFLSLMSLCILAVYIVEYVSCRFFFLGFFICGISSGASFSVSESCSYSISLSFSLSSSNTTFLYFFGLFWLCCYCCCCWKYWLIWLMYALSCLFSWLTLSKLCFALSRVLFASASCLSLFSKDSLYSSKLFSKSPNRKFICSSFIFCWFLSVFTTF